MADLFPDPCPLLVQAIGASSGPDPLARCGAVVDGDLVGLRQQRLVCLGSGHLDCPRFTRAIRSGRGMAVMLAASPGRRAPQVDPPALEAGASDVAGAPAFAAASLPSETAIPRPSDVGSDDRQLPPPRSIRRRRGEVPLAVLVAAAILGLAVITAVGFTLARGGLSIPPGSGGPGGEPSASVPPIASAEASGIASPVAGGSASPSPGGSGAPARGSTGSVAPSPRASGDPFAGLPACPDRPGCVVYRIQVGDRLIALADRFGVAYPALLTANPEIVDPNRIRVGQTIRIPTSG